MFDSDGGGAKTANVRLRPGGGVAGQGGGGSTSAKDTYQPFWAGFGHFGAIFGNVWPFLSVVGHF